MLASLFAGWDTLLLVTILILFFCEMNNNLKNVMIRIITFYFGLTLFNVVWGLIVDGINLIPSLINQLISLINNYLSEPINPYKLELYLFKPILEVVSIANTIVDYLLTFIKFSFIVSVLANKPIKENFIVNKINNFVRKCINFINIYEVNQNTQSIQQQPVMNNAQAVPQQAMQQTQVVNSNNNISN